MRVFKKIIMLVLSVSITLSICVPNISAMTYVDGNNVTVVNNGYYRIQHVESGKFLDIRDKNMENGAVLQIWEEYAHNNNQIFQLIGVGDSKIVIKPNHSSGKVVEVRNSSMDDRAEVAQWDYVGIATQQWLLYQNEDNTYSFKNANSGLFLNIEGNNCDNGTRVIQYHDDGTTAMKFKLYRLDDTDITMATWRMDESSVVYTPYKITTYTKNFTHYDGYMENGNLYLPTTGKKYLYSIEYIDYYTLLHTIGDSAKLDTLETMFKKFSRDKLIEISGDKIIEYANKKGLGYLSDIVINKGSYVIELLYMIYTDKSNKEWNVFVDNAIKAMEQNCDNPIFNKCGLKVTTYNTIYMGTGYGLLSNGTTAYGSYNIISDKFSYSYSVWDEMSINRNVNYSGNWSYKFA